jgi:uncharacterized membrane protein
MAGAPTPQERFETRFRERGVERLIMFSDAVFAIAMTLLVLDLRVPLIPSSLSTDATNSQLARDLANLAPAYFAYVLSFTVIAVYWRAHHRKFLAIERVDDGLVVLNLLFLLSVSFLPFPTSVLSRYGNTVVATVLYACSMTLVGALSGLITLWAGRRHLNAPEVDVGHARFAGWRSMVVPIVFAVSIPVALADPKLARWMWLLIAPLIVATDLIYRRGRRRPTPTEPILGSGA